MTRRNEAVALRELEEAFSTLFQVRPLRSYGTDKKPHQGFSDDRQGVQWNAGIDRNRDVLTLGVNLEGMAYDGWPIARLIERELARPRLLGISSMPRLGECELWFTRDAWQVSTRLAISEEYLTPQVPQLLKTLTEKLWRDVLRNAQGCLDPGRGHRGRRKTEVTLLSSGARLIRDVSPHLQIKFVLDTPTRASGSAIMDALQSARETLVPVHRWMVEQSRP